MTGWIGPVIGAVGSLLSARKSRGPSVGEQISAGDRAFRQRVATLKELGMSPLFAAGAGVQAVAPPPDAIGGLGEAVSGIGQSITAYQSQRKSDAANAVLREQTVAESQARVRKDDAMAAYYTSQAALAEHQRTASPSAPTTTPAAAFDAVQTTPVQIPSVQSKAPHVSAGVVPGFVETRVRPGLTLLTPRSEEGLHEVMESGINPAYLLAMLSANQQAYGDKEGLKRVATLYGWDVVQRALAGRKSSTDSGPAPRKSYNRPRSPESDRRFRESLNRGPMF